MKIVFELEVLEHGSEILNGEKIKIALIKLVELLKCDLLIFFS